MPSYMDSLDLSDISDYEDYMVTSSNEDIPAFRDTPYWEMLWFDLNSFSSITNYIEHIFSMLNSLSSP